MAPTPSPSPRLPRNLVVLSDGTGNSAAKLQKTNVWRLYDALDLSAGDQIASYDDGVGTASVKPLAILGGAFGYGLKRNVLDLYAFLCRHYQGDPDEPATCDRIFAFGFSRGAFTARVVASLVTRVGLVRADSEAELRRLSRWAYRVYRAERFPHAWPVRMLRTLRDVALRAWDAARGLPAFDPARTVRPEVTFLGVWDTVAAYGLPVDELTRGWERWIWPTLPRDRDVSPRVRRACHAMAIDDERQTFFPLLWNERYEAVNATSTHVDEERVTQVWFAGMHSDVGGGYADDGLAHAPLAWMAGEACKHGLRFRPSLRRAGGPLPDDWIERAGAAAPMHDSRRGLGVYYRYHPRPVERLSDDPDARVFVARPKVHFSVFDRMRAGTQGYAPMMLPERYAVVTGDGHIVDGTSSPASPYEHPSQSAARRGLQEHALDAVWWRRVAYFLTVAATLVVLAIPLIPIPVRAGWLDARQSTLASLVGLLDAVLPATVAPWVRYYQDRPFQLLAGVLVVGILVAWSSWLSGQITERMRRIWRQTGLEAHPVDPVEPPGGWVYRLRTHPWYRLAFHTVPHRVVPNVFGLAMLALLFVVLPVRVSFEVRSRAGLLPDSTCGAAAPTRLPGESTSFALWPSLLCNATGIAVREGQTYRIDVALPPACESDDALAPEARRTGTWADSRIPVSSPAGFSSWSGDMAVWQRAVMTLAVVLRRDPTANWFAVTRAIGATNPARALVGDGLLVAERDGPLSLYVNDAILPCPSWACFYRNNAGGPARVRVMAVDGPLTETPPLAPYDCAQQAQLALRR